MENRIRIYRRALGLSQHRLGKKVGLTRITINNIENCKTTPSLKVAKDIADAVERPIEAVFALDGRFHNDF